MRLEVLVGPIASGKSTYCIERAREGAMVINDDAIVNSLHANQYDKWNKKLKPLYKAIENLSITISLVIEVDI